jgi:hypothetical protein
LRSLAKIGESLSTQSLIFNGIWLETELPLVVARNWRRCTICQEIEPPQAMSGPLGGDWIGPNHRAVLSKQCFEILVTP